MLACAAPRRYPRPPRLPCTPTAAPRASTGLACTLTSPAPFASWNTAPRRSRRPRPARGCRRTHDFRTPWTPSGRWSGGSVGAERPRRSSGPGGAGEGRPPTSMPSTTRSAPPRWRDLHEKDADPNAHSCALVRNIVLDSTPVVCARVRGRLGSCHPHLGTRQITYESGDVRTP